MENTCQREICSWNLFDTGDRPHWVHWLPHVALVVCMMVPKCSNWFIEFVSRYTFLYSMDEIYKTTLQCLRGQSVFLRHILFPKMELYDLMFYIFSMIDRAEVRMNNTKPTDLTSLPRTWTVATSDDDSNTSDIDTPPWDSRTSKERDLVSPPVQ